MDEKQIKSAVLDAFEVSLDAQLRAIRRLKQDKAEPRRVRKGMSQVDMAYDILQRANGPLHISDILDRIASVWTASRWSRRWPRKFSGRIASPAPTETSSPY